MKNERAIAKHRSFLILLVSTLTATANVLFATHYLASMVIISVEVLVLFYYLSKNDLVNYLGCYLLFLCLSFEFSSFIGVEEFYGFKNFRIAGMNLGIVMLLPLLVKFIFTKFAWRNLVTKYRSLFRFISTMIAIIAIAFFVGMLNLLVNDNNVLQMAGFIKFFVGNFYELGLYPILIMVAFLNIVTRSVQNVEVLKEYMFGVMFGSVVSMIVSISSSVFGTYGGVQTLLVPNVVNFLPFFGGMIFYKELIQFKKSLIFGYLFGMVLLFNYNASGKLILILMLLPIYIIFVLKERKALNKMIVMLVFIPIMIWSGNLIIQNYSNSILFQSKLAQASALIDITSKDWFDKLPESPKFRISEFVNIGYEYLDKPQYLMFGKGFFGTIKDHIGQFIYTDGAFTTEEWKIGSFYTLHASINTMFLTYGMLGLIIYLCLVYNTVTKLIKVQWGIIGAYWFLIYYGYSITLSAFGLMALLIALRDYDVLVSARHVTDESEARVRIAE